MKISMWMLFDEVSDKCVRNNLNDHSKKRCIQGIMPYSESTQMDGIHLFIVDATRSKALDIRTTGVNYFVFVGENFKLVKDSNCQYIVMPAALGFVTCIQNICSVFDKYSSWFDELQCELNNQMNLNAICEIGFKLLKNPLSIHDKQFHFTVASGDVLIDPEEREYFIDLPGPYGTVHNAILEKTEKNKSFSKSLSTSEATIIDLDVFKNRSMLVNIGSGDSYEGRLCVIEKLHSFRNSDQQIAEILAEIIKYALRQQNIHNDDVSKEFRSFIRRLLSEDMINHEYLESKLQLWHWHRNGRFICIKVIPNDDYFEPTIPGYLTSKIEYVIRNSCALNYSEYIVCIVYLKENESIQDVVDQFKALLDSFNLKICLSNIYEDIAESYVYIKQAEIACEIGESIAPGEWSHLFRTYATIHYHIRGTSVLPAIHFCDMDVRKLMQINSRANYYLTLKAYLENKMNLLKTSEVLFIHRTTLFKRINKIKSILSESLDNPDYVYRLISSFKIMEIDQLLNKEMSDKLAKSTEQECTPSGNLKIEDTEIFPSLLA